MDVVFPKPGKYVVAVSGGVDSMVLLDLLSQQTGLKLVVAHLDHGMRDDSAEDTAFIKSASDTLGVPFVCHHVKLGAGASEEKAREARYGFLNQINKETNADGIITAHHQDDLIETAILNMLRGTDRKGLSSLGSGGNLLRPLLNVPKSELLAYAKAQGVMWREDNTNSDQKYTRNYVRHNYVTNMSPATRKKLLGVINKMQEINPELDSLLVKYIQNQSVDGSIDRVWFSQLSHKLAREVIASWLRDKGVRNFDAKAIERIVVAAKTAQTGKTFPVISGYNVRVGRDKLALVKPEVPKNTKEKV